MLVPNLIIGWRCHAEAHQCRVISSSTTRGRSKDLLLKGGGYWEVTGVTHLCLVSLKPPQTLVLQRVAQVTEIKQDGRQSQTDKLIEADL